LKAGFNREHLLNDYADKSRARPFQYAYWKSPFVY